MKKLFVLTLLFIFFGTASVLAQSRHYNAQSLGMGGGGTAYADGYHANFINPANLMLSMHKQKNTLGLMGGIGVRAGGSLLNVSVYNKYLTKGLTIDGEVRENMLTEWFGSNSANMRGQAATVNLQPFGFAHRGSTQAFSIATRMRISQNANVNKGVMELLTYGLDSQKFANPVPLNFQLTGVVFAEISVGYARHLMNLPDMLFARDIKLYAGVAPKYLYGVYTSKLDFRSTLQVKSATATTPFSIQHNFGYDLFTIGEISRQLQAYEAAHKLDKDTELGDYVDFSGDDFSGPQATGFGLDMGATLEMDVSSLPIPLFQNHKKTLRVSMSLIDLGKLKFEKDASSVYAEGDFTFKGMQDGDDFDTFFENLGDSLSSDVYGKFDSKAVNAIEYKLPGMYNFGTSLEMGNLLLALDYGFGFNQNGTNSKRSVLNLGAQYKLFGFMPFRVGTRMGGFSSTSYSAGFGLDFNIFEFTVGASVSNNSAKNGYAMSAAWSGLVIRF